MKRFLSLFFLILLIGVSIVGYLVLKSTTQFAENKKALYIKSGSTYADVQTQLSAEGFVGNTTTFDVLAGFFGLKNQVKPGKYVFEKGSSVLTILRTLKNGRQTPVKLVINKLRLPSEFAQKIADNFECDLEEVSQLITNSDTLKKWGVDSNTFMTLIIPNTYEFYWNTSANRILKKLIAEQQKFWTAERVQKANGLNLTPIQAYTLASIVEEETNMAEDKGKIASVYLNRIETGMRLGADPTVKFALKNFALTRIYQKHTQFESPFNTYKVFGLPPGPICTPSVKTLEAVLNAPTTNYLYFVAKPDFNGYSNFATTYKEHLQYAKAYQDALSIEQAKAAK